MFEVQECRKSVTNGYIKVQAFDATRGVESCVCSFIIQRPEEEPGFYLTRTEHEGRMHKYTINSYSVNTKPAGERY